MDPYSTELICDDLLHFLHKQGQVSGPFAHTDLYGVLHHLEDPSVVLSKLAEHMSGGATLRIMVYNTKARTWIEKLRRLFFVLGLKWEESTDLELGKGLLEAIAFCNLSFQDKLSQMGPSLLKNKTRFADTFFHVKVLSYLPSKWIDLLESSGFRPYALFDRYGELDHLENPLWKMPSGRELDNEVSSGSMEGNIELYSFKDQKKSRLKTIPTASHLLLGHGLDFYKA